MEEMASGHGQLYQQIIHEDGAGLSESMIMPGTAARNGPLGHHQQQQQQRKRGRGGGGPMLESAVAVAATSVASAGSAPDKNHHLHQHQHQHLGQVGSM
jgi:hypothetical protein